MTRWQLRFPTEILWPGQRNHNSNPMKFGTTGLLGVVARGPENASQGLMQISLPSLALLSVTLGPPSTQYREKAMAAHSSALAWKIPWTEESGGLQSMGLLRVGHNWAASLSLFTFMHWRRKWQPTPVFLPGESQGQRSLVGCRLWGRTKSDTTEAT